MNIYVIEVASKSIIVTITVAALNIDDALSKYRKSNKFAEAIGEIIEVRRVMTGVQI